MNIELNSIVNTLFPNEVKGLIVPIDDFKSHLLPDEAQQITSYSEKRKREFSTGRWCARKLLQSTGCDINFPIVSGDDREPIWPDNYTGSISHCKKFAGVVLTKKNRISSVGLDLEDIKKLKFDISDHICTKKEKDWLSLQKQNDRNILHILLFSLKESLYKAFFQLSGKKLLFQDVTIIPDRQQHTTEIAFTEKQPGDNFTLTQRFHISPNHVLAGTTICNINDL